MQQEFIARGLASRDKARSTGRYVSAEAAFDRLQAQLDKAKTRKP